MKIGIAADHGGYEMKEELILHLQKGGLEVIDYGTHGLESVDYPDYAKRVSQGVLSGEVQWGIAICGTGVGISIACNKINGIRAAHCTDSYTGRVVRKHNNANILCLGGRITGIEIAKDIVDAFLSSDFDGGRHAMRVDKVMAIEEGEL